MTKRKWEMTWEPAEVNKKMLLQIPEKGHLREIVRFGLANEYYRGINEGLRKGESK